jgi:hypothetical protein
MLLCDEADSHLEDGPRRDTLLVLDQDPGSTRRYTRRRMVAVQQMRTKL